MGDCKVAYGRRAAAGGEPATAATPPDFYTHTGTGLFVLKGFIMDRTRGTHCAKGPLL